MKTMYQVTVRINTLVGNEERKIEVEARDYESALKKISRIMGNRDYAPLDFISYKAPQIAREKGEQK